MIYASEITIRSSAYKCGRMGSRHTTTST